MVNEMDKTEILYGIHSVHEALLAGKRKFYEIFLAGTSEAAKLAPVVRLAEQKGILIKKTAADKIRHLAQADRHQNIAAKVTAYPYAALDNRPAMADGKPAFYLMLDHIQDPQNLGAVLRTALCAGVAQVIIPKDRSAGATPAVSRASAGALEHIHLVRVTNLVNTLKELRQAGVWAMGLDREGQSAVYATDLAVPLCIVLGGEDTGVRPLVKKWCDTLISIPQIDKFNSLNASVAAAVVLYEAFRQRHFNP